MNGSSLKLQEIEVATEQKIKYIQVSKSVQILHTGLVCESILISRKKMGVGPPMWGGRLTPPGNLGKMFNLSMQGV